MQIDAHEISDMSQLVKFPRVSILMITYNHASYLSQAIEGVLEQKCNFPFELLIGEDASNDATLQVAMKYQKLHPKTIRVIYSSNNVGMNANALRIFRKARGEYIAYCEGDDFWCSTDKLEKQVELMESDKKIGIVHSDWVRAHPQGGEWIFDLNKSVHRRVSTKYLCGDLFKTWHYPKILRTCTILLRRSTVNEWYASGLMNLRYHFGDSVLTVYITSRWKVGYIPAVMAVYRVSPNSALRSGTKARVAFYQSSLQFDTDARKFFSGSTTEYHSGYRWDATAGLLLWGLKARDFSAVKSALLDFWRNFTAASFIKTGIHSCLMRLPTLKRQPRQLPDITKLGH